MPWGTAPTWMSFSPPSPRGGGPEGCVSTLARSSAGRPSRRLPRPWSKPVRLFEAQQGQIDADTNLAVVILANGSVVGLARTGTKVNGIAIHLVTAGHWKAAASYTGRWDQSLFDLRSVPPTGLEDPFVWQGRGGVFHAVFHNQIQNDDERLCGGHAFSEDGRHWTFTGTAWGNSATLPARPHIRR